MDWQTPLALIVVLLSAAGLTRALWPRRGGGCGSGCGKCSSGKAPAKASPGGLVQLGNQHRPEAKPASLESGSKARA